MDFGDGGVTPQRAAQRVLAAPGSNDKNAHPFIVPVHDARSARPGGPPRRALSRGSHPDPVRDGSPGTWPVARARRPAGGGGGGSCGPLTPSAVARPGGRWKLTADPHGGPFSGPEFRL
ncbi:hypothetical protein TBS_19810 [Thermobispora bispora]